jgi:hypothetical protein
MQRTETNDRCSTLIIVDCVIIFVKEDKKEKEDETNPSRESSKRQSFICFSSTGSTLIVSSRLLLLLLLLLLSLFIQMIIIVFTRILFIYLCLNFCDAQQNRSSRSTDPCSTNLSCIHGVCDRNQTVPYCICDRGWVIPRDGTTACTYQQKSKLAAFLLSFLVGGLGADWFYLSVGNGGYIAAGVFKLLTLGGLGIWWLVDWIRILTNSFLDGQGIALLEWSP